MTLLPNNIILFTVGLQSINRSLNRLKYHSPLTSVSSLQIGNFRNYVQAKLKPEDYYSTIFKKSQTQSLKVFCPSCGQAYLP